MKDFNYYINQYKEQLDKGDIQEAYAGLVKYLIKLRTTLSKNLSEHHSFGSIFQGYMDYTYFYFSNDILKKRKLKMGFVLNHRKMQFELWLLGHTIPIQEKYWEYFKSTKWNKGRTNKPQYSILETVIIEKPNFGDLKKLSKQIESKLTSVTKQIILDIQRSSTF